MQIILTAFLSVSILIVAGLFVFAITRRDRSNSVYFALLTVAIFIYSLGYLLEITSGTEEAITLALKVENVGIPLLAPLFAMTIFNLVGGLKVKKSMMLATALHGLFIFVTVFTNESHLLYYSSMTLDTSNGAYFVRLGHGPIYIYQQAVSITIMTITYVILGKSLIRGGRKIRKQMTNIILGSLIVFVANILNFSGVLPTGLDITPFALSIGTVFFAISLLKYDLMDIIIQASDLAIRTMEDAMVVIDVDGGFLFCNKSAEKLFPALASYVKTESLFELEGWPKELLPDGRAKQVTFSVKNPETKESSTHRAYISAVEEVDLIVGWSIVIRDITDMTILLNQLEEQANLDSLTGLLTRRKFLQEAQDELAKKHAISPSLLMYDLDYFKKVNDTYGHLAGDYILCEVANVIKEQWRPDDFMGRYGGEEFLIFLTSAPDVNLESFADRICRTVAQNDFVFEGKHIPITISIGAVKIEDDCTFDEATRIVDEATYQAKSAGRNCAVVGTV